MVQKLAETQRFFYELLECGDVSEGWVVAVNENGTTIRTEAGYTGRLESSFRFIQGKILEVFFDHFDNGLPIFKPTENWMLRNLPQVATVCVVTKRGMGLLFEDKIVDGEGEPVVHGVYRPQDGVPEKFQDLKPGDKVEVSIAGQEGSTYLIKEIKSVLPEVQKPVVEEVKKWTIEQVEAKYRSGFSKKVYGKIRLGNIYEGDPCNINQVRLPGDVIATIVSQRKPGQEARKIVVQVTCIRDDNTIEVEYCRTIPAKKLPDNVDEEKYLQALKKGSVGRCGGYFPGGAYKLKAVDGKPEVKNNNPGYELANSHIKKITVEVDEGSYCLINGRYYLWEVIFIEDVGGGEYIITTEAIGKA